MSRSLRRQLVQQLEGEIAAGALQPGSHIDERSIGERFGISRTPAREILVELSAAGLVRYVPRRGAVIISMTPPESGSMVEVLVALEGDAAALAPRRMAEGERTSIERIYAEGTAQVDDLSPENYLKINLVLHEAIYVGCRNQFLASEIKKLRSRLQPYLRSNFVARGRLRSSHAEHQAVLAAIGAYDESAAERAMREHLLNGGRLFADMLVNLNATAPS